MKRQWSARQQRMLALGLLLLVILTIGAVVATPTWWLHARYDNFIVDYTDRLQRYQRVAALRPVIDAEIEAIRKEDPRKYYLKGTSSSIAVAELQGIVTKIVEDHRGKIISSQVLPPRGDEAKTTGPVKVAISIQMNASIIPLQLILHSLESHLPYLFVEQLTVRAPQGRMYKPQPGIQPEYVTQLTVAGYSLGTGAKP